MVMDVSGQAKKSSSAFRMECGVGLRVRADAATVWRLLTSAAEFRKWNTTVTSLEGEIAPGKVFALRVVIAPSRVFKLKVTTFEPAKRMVWASGAAPMFKGERTFVLEPRADGATDFSMVEVFSGVMLPLIKGSLPDFGPPFEQFAADLKRAAETGS